MLPISLIALGALLSLAKAQGFGAYVHDLDDESTVTRLTYTGLNLSPYSREAYLSATSDSGASAQGYVWVVDYDDCDRVLDITSSTAYYPSTDPEVDNSYSEETFTLTARTFGSCDFTIAYAIPWQFSDFDKFAKEGGRVITIPIRVVESEQTPSQASNSRSNPDDKWIEPLPADYDWSKDKKHFKIFGWCQLFQGIWFVHIISNLPTAVQFFRVQGGNLWVAQSFKWFVRKYSEIAGWVASVGNIAIGAVLIMSGSSSSYSMLLSATSSPSTSFSPIVSSTYCCGGSTD